MNKVKDKQKLDWKNIFILFLVGCVIGTFYEEILHFIKYASYEPRRALIWGPFNPLYGIGFTIFVIVLYPTWNRRSRWMNYVACAVLGGATEAFSSLFTETLFGIKAWDYSNHFLNIFGRTTLPFALFWGLGGYVIVTYIYPYVCRKTRLILPAAKKSFCTAMMIFMIMNVAMTLLVVYTHVCHLENRELNGTIFKMVEEKYPEEFMNKKFPNWEYNSLNDDN